MKVLITGNRGFIGTETQKLLESMNYQIVGFDLMDGFDILDFNQLDAVINQEKPTRILHLAAIARFSDADKNPRLAFDTNVIGTLNVVRVAKKWHIPLVYASTGSAIMPLNDYQPPFDENIPARGNSVYGCTKAIGEYLVKEHIPHIILRYGHIYGKEKRYHGLISGFLDRMKRGLSPILYGGQQTNSFVYVKDITRANYLALTAFWDCWDQVYNIGSPEELTTEYVFGQIKKMTGYKGKIEKIDQRTVDPVRFVFNVDKAERMLGFKCDYDFKTGLEEMLNEMGMLKKKVNLNDKK